MLDTLLYMPINVSDPLFIYPGSRGLFLLFFYRVFAFDFIVKMPRVQKRKAPASKSAGNKKKGEFYVACKHHMHLK
jgi:hypothetical protein